MLTDKEKEEYDPRNEYDFDELLGQLENQETFLGDGSNYDENECYKSLYLGKIFSISPSGKYYTGLTTNQTEKDVELDRYFWEIFDEELEKRGMFAESGEGDPTDIMLTKKVKCDWEEKMIR